MFLEVMLAGLSYFGGSNTTYTGRLSYSFQPKIISTTVEQPIVKQSLVSSDLWGSSILWENLGKLQSFGLLEKGWDGYDAEAIPQRALLKSAQLLSSLRFQPSIFPTGRKSVQIEYYRDDDTFTEVEVSEDGISVYSEGVFGTIEEDHISEQRACELLEAVYERV